MECCTNQCDQGRNCPAKVTRVKKQYPRYRLSEINRSGFVERLLADVYRKLTKLHPLG
jgi:uncharacterized metal-binding protein